MKNQNLLLVFFFLLIGSVGGFYLFSKKEDKDLEGLTVNIEPTEPTPPPPPSVAPVFYDPAEGTGLQAVIVQSAKILKDKSRMSQIRNSENIGTSFLQNTPKIGVDSVGSNRFKEFLNGQIENFISYTDAPLMPSFVEPAIKRQLQEAQQMGENWNYKGNTDRTNAAINMLELLDFTRFPAMGYKLWAKDKSDLWNKFVTNSNVYGDATNDDKTNNNYKKFGNDSGVIAENMLKAIERLDEIIQIEAMNDLRKKGWKFEGDLP
jgi:hypothetical protein